MAVKKLETCRRKGERVLGFNFIQGYIVRLLLVALSLFFFGCSSVPGSVDPNYKLYSDTMAAYANVEQKPLVKIELHPGGGLKTLEVTMPQAAPRIQPWRRQPNEWVQFAQVAASVAFPVIGGVLNSYYQGEAFAKVLRASNGGISGSYNTYGSHNTDQDSTLQYELLYDQSQRNPVFNRNITDSFDTDNSINDSFDPSFDIHPNVDIHPNIDNSDNSTTTPPPVTTPPPGDEI